MSIISFWAPAIGTQGSGYFGVNCAIVVIVNKNCYVQNKEDADREQSPSKHEEKTAILHI